MKFLSNKKFTQKIIIVLIAIILFNFAVPIRAQAAWDWTGSLFEPIADLICGIGDAIINALQGVFFPYSPKAVDKRSVAEIEAGKDLGWKNTAMKLLGKLQGSFLFGWNPTFQAAGEAQEALYTDMIIPYIKYGPATIFSNQIPAFDIDFINPEVKTKDIEMKEIEYQIKAVEKEIEETNSTDYEDSAQKKATLAALNASKDKLEKVKAGDYEDLNTAYVLRPTIATWYIALRNIAIVGLLCVLVFIGIRIMISSASEDKAKYKSMLKDWLIAICILFFLHYFMALVLKLIQIITDAFPIVTNSQDTIMETVRSSAAVEDYMQKMGYAIMYMVLIFYTIIFTWKYLKRAIYMAFLTIISPLVALTYPIDKIKDGEAQAFNTWMREYIFNAMLQPMHLLLYYILVGSAVDLVETNVIYALVAIGFLLPAEKIIRRFFGFDKAQGGGLGVGAAVTGGAIFAGATSLLKNVGASKAAKLTGGSGGSSGGSDGKIRYSRGADSNASSGLDAFKSDSGSSGGTNGESGMTVNSVNMLRQAGRSTNPFLNNLKTPSNSRAIPRIRPSTQIPGMIAGPRIGTGVANPTKPKKTLKLKKTAGKVFSGAGRVALIGAKQLPRVAKTGVKLAAGATLGGIGLAAGLASEDDADIVKYTLMGATAGYLGAGGVMNAVTGAGRGITSGAKNIADEYQRGYHGDEYADKVLNKRLDKQWEKDSEQYYKDKYGSNWKEKQKIGKDLRSYGIDNQKDIDTATKLMDKNPGLKVAQAAGVMNFTKDLNKSDLLNKETREELYKQARAMTSSEEKADQVMSLADQRFKIKTIKGSNIDKNGERLIKNKEQSKNRMENLKKNRDEMMNKYNGNKDKNNLN